jgi:hypothetical protein
VTDPTPLHEAHALQQAALQQKIDLASAVARGPGEWLDIYRAIVEQAVRQTLEANGDDGTEVQKRLKENAPHFDRVRRDFAAHGLPLLEEIEVEGARIITGPSGVDEGFLYDDPSNPEVRFYWPSEGSKPKPLCFQGQAGVVALTFIRWWTGFQEVALKQSGQEREVSRRIVTPGSSDYLRYLFGR